MKVLLSAGICSVALGAACALAPFTGVFILAALAVVGLKFAVRINWLSIGYATLFAGRAVQGVVEQRIGTDGQLLLDILNTLVIILSIPRLARLPRSIAWPVAVFAVISLLAGLPSVASQLSYGLLGIRALLLPLATGLLAALSADWRRDRMAIALGILFGWSINVWYALRQLVTGYTAAELHSIKSTDATYLVGAQVRTLGAQVSNQDFGLYAATIAVTALTYVLASQPGKRRIAASALLLIAAPLVFTSLLRGVLIAFITVFVVSISMALSSRGLTIRPLLVVSAVGLIGLSWAATITPAIQQRLSASVSRFTSVFGLASDRSYNERVQGTLPRAWNIFLQHPWGSGAGSAGPVSQSNALNAPFGALVPDNGFLLVGIQTGFVGVLVLAWLVSAVAHRSLVLRAVVPVQLLGANLMILLLMCMLFGNYWSLTGPTSLLWYVAMSCMRSLKVEERSEAEEVSSGHVSSPVARRCVRVLD